MQRSPDPSPPPPPNPRRQQFLNQIARYMAQLITHEAKLKETQGTLGDQKKIFKATMDDIMAAKSKITQMSKLFHDWDKVTEEQKSVRIGVAEKMMEDCEKEVKAINDDMAEK